jgi:hypothetical protein
MKLNASASKVDRPGSPSGGSTNAEGGGENGEENNAKGELNLNSRLSYIPVPVCHVLRDTKRFLVDAKEIIIGDVVLLDSKVSGLIPADIILVETNENEEFIISNYVDSFDPKNSHLYSYRNGSAEIPPSAS